MEEAVLPRPHSVEATVEVGSSHAHPLAFPLRVETGGTLGGQTGSLRFRCTSDGRGSGFFCELTSVMNLGQQASRLAAHGFLQRWALKSF